MARSEGGASSAARPSDADYTTGERVRPWIRGGVLALLFLAPAAFGSTFEIVYIPLLIVGGSLGALSWARGRWAQAHGHALPDVPGARLLVALHALVIVQLVPLPPFLLRFISPGSFKLYDAVSLVPLTEWRPISVNPWDTLRGLTFLFVMSLVYAAVFREFDTPRARRLVMLTVLATAVFITIEALVQAASPHPNRLYGFFQPKYDWAVFGPYVNRGKFAGYVAMALPLALGFCAQGLAALGDEWRARPRHWVALGGTGANQAIRHLAVTVTLAIGIVAANSRGGVMAMVAGSLIFVIVAASRRQVAAGFLAALAVTAGVGWIGLSRIQRGFETRGIEKSRLMLWRDALRMFPDFPVFGSGFDSFGTIYMRYQKVLKPDWVGEAHNEYLQALLDDGIIGALIVAGLLAVLFGRAVRYAGRSPVRVGLLGSLSALCAHNLVDFQWQVPANALTFAALAGLAVQAPRETADPDPDVDAAG